MAPQLLTWAVAALAAAPMVSGHINLAYPTPYDYEAHIEDKGPMTTSEYPCKSQTYSYSGTAPSIAVGDQQTALFNGTAVHGGGSCQFAITLDEKPSVSSTFKVIHSIEGGCPGTDGAAEGQSFTIPSSVPSGDVTFAWTWFSKEAGQPEMYMNCAPITVTGGASDNTEFNALPDMLIANVGISGFAESATSSDSSSEAANTVSGTTLPQCTQVLSSDLKFPAPGDSLAKGSGTLNLQSPVGACADSSDDSSSDSSSTAAGSSTAAASTAAASNTGGVFAPSASSASSTLTTLVTVTAGASNSAVSTPVAVSTPNVVATPVYSTPAAASTPTSSSSSTTCSTNGEILCNGTSQFGICSNGQVIWQDVAAGTECNNGEITKRSLPHGGRFFRPRPAYA